MLAAAEALIRTHRLQLEMHFHVKSVASTMDGRLHPLIRKACFGYHSPQRIDSKSNWTVNPIISNPYLTGKQFNSKDTKCDKSSTGWKNIRHDTCTRVLAAGMTYTCTYEYTQHWVSFFALPSSHLIQEFIATHLWQDFFSSLTNLQIFFLHWMTCLANVFSDSYGANWLANSFLLDDGDDDLDVAKHHTPRTRQ